MRLTLVLESSTQMKHLLAFGAIAALGMGVSAAPRRGWHRLLLPKRQTDLRPAGFQPSRLRGPAVLRTPLLRHSQHQCLSRPRWRWRRARQWPQWLLCALAPLSQSASLRDLSPCFGRGFFMAQGQASIKQSGDCIDHQQPNLPRWTAVLMDHSSHGWHPR